MKKSIVTNIFNHISDSINILAVGNDTLYVTDYHPIYVIGKGWVKVKNLKINDKLFLFTNKKAIVISNKKIKWNKPVYNVEVNLFHNYFVSEQGILVHNK